MRKIPVLILFCFILSYNVIGSSFLQDAEVDTNLNHIRDLIKRMVVLRDSSFNESIKFGEKTIALVKESGEPSITALAYKTQGVSYFYQGVFDSALYHYNKAIPEFEKANEKLNVGKVLNNIAIVYRRTNKLELALEKYLEAIKVYESVNYTQGLAGAYSNVGSLYHSVEGYAKAERFYLLALSMLEKLEISYKLARIHMNLGVLYLEQLELDKSLKYLKKAYKLNKKYDTAQQEAIILLNLGQVAFYKQEYDKALNYYHDCEVVREELNDYWGLPKIYVYTAQCLAITGKYKEALVKLQASEEICLEYKLADDLADTYLHKSILFETLKDSEQAFIYYKKGDNLRDSLELSNRSKKLDELEIKHSLNLKEKELDIKNLALSRKNIFLFSLLGFIFLATAFIIFYLRSRTISNKLNTLSLEQKVRLSQMNPHFIFNSLSAIQDFILENKNDEAFTFLSKLTGLIRGVLENSTHDYISVREELDILASYIELQKLRFGDAVSYRFDIDKDIDLDEIRIPPMLAQPIIENSLLHAELRKNPNAEIKICLLNNSENKSIDFSVEDNGVGIMATQNLSNTRKSMATQILKDRVRIYNYYSKNGLSFEVIDLKTLNDDLHGTRVCFSIPIQKHYSAN